MTSKTATSTPRLSEYARHFSYPTGITKTVWTRVEAKGKQVGLGFDWWQSQLGTVCLGYGTDGKYVATVGGIGMSIPRQVGKTYFVMALLFIMCILFPGYKVVWTSHHMRTTTKTLTTMKGLSKRRKIAPFVRSVRVANGEGQIEFTNDSIIMFGARSQGFGRGFDEIDAEVFDEAQILDTKALEDMVAATNQSRHEHGALLFYLGTPPRPTDQSDDFTARRKEAWAGEARDAIWLEIGAEPKSAPDDRSQWPLMNPSYPKRTPIESMLRLKANLKDPDSWNREGRGVWDDEEVKGDLDYGRWKDLADSGAERGTEVCFGVDVAEDRSGWIAVTWRREADDLVQVMLVNDGRALPAHRLVDEAKRLTDAWAGPVMGPRSFEDDFDKAGVDVLPPMSSADAAEACSQLDNLIASGELRHGNQTALNESVRLVKWRRSSNPAERTFQLAGAPEAGPVMAVVRALHGLDKYQSAFAIH